MSIDSQALAKIKSRETQHPVQEWLKVIESARMSLKPLPIDPPSLREIIMASRTPEKFVTMTRLIFQYAKSYPNGARISQLILDYSNESPFSLPDWIDAIDYFHLWLEEHQRKIDFLPMLKYLQCCVAAPEARKSGQTLKGLLEDMLRVFGYDGGPTKA